MVNRFFVNFYIIKILGRLFKKLCKSYRFVCEIFKIFEILLYIRGKY